MSSNNPIGIFDSGLGGLTVARALRAQLPRESLIYYGDTARVPYGTKSPETIVRFTRDAIAFLCAHDVKCIVVACNTASAVALPQVQADARVPLVGVIDAGARAAAAATRAAKVGVIGTPATIASDVYTRAIQKLNPAITVYAQPCPLLVPLAEEGWGDRPATRLVIEEYLSPLRIAKIDTLVLGCTHYPLLATPIQAYLGSGVTLVDSAVTCAEDLAALLARDNLLATQAWGAETFFVTDMPARFAELGARFLGRRIQAIKVVGTQ